MYTCVCVRPWVQILMPVAIVIETCLHVVSIQAIKRYGQVVLTMSCRYVLLPLCFLCRSDLHWLGVTISTSQLACKLVCHHMSSIWVTVKPL